MALLPENGTIVATGIALLALGLFALLERRWPQFPSASVGHDLTNLGLGGLNALLRALLVGGTAALAAGTRDFGLLRWLALPPAVEWALALVLFDLWMYAWHVLNHRSRLLWRFHSVHHTDGALDASSGVRFHAGEIAFSEIARLAVVPLLGMEPAQLLVYEAVVRPIVFFHHSNVRIPESVDRALRAFIVTPRMHWVHHSSWQPETDSNYASGLSLWDHVFGTFRLREDPDTLQLGLEGHAPNESLGTLLALPFQRRRSEAA